MTTSTITSKGQTTIPVDIRNHLNLHTGDKLEFIMLDNSKVMLVPATSDVSELKGFLPRPKKTISIKEMKKAIKKRGSELGNKS
jgi:AbrB family looped-hinge helix DNA binding protein